MWFIYVNPYWFFSFSFFTSGQVKISNNSAEIVDPKDNVCLRLHNKKGLTLGVAFHWLQNTFSADVLRSNLKKMFKFPVIIKPRED